MRGDMKKLILLILLLMPAQVWAFGNMVSGSVAGGGGVTTYVGWANSGGVPTGTPSSSYPAGDNLSTTRWVATEGGTATTIQAYITTHLACDTEVVALFRDISGTITLVGQGTFTGATGEWTGEITLVAESGQTLDFSTDDILYFGVVASTTSGSSYYVGRNDSGGTGMYYGAGDYATGAPATTSLFTSSGREMAFILGYQ